MRGWMLIAILSLGAYLSWQRFTHREPPPAPSLAGVYADVQIYTTSTCGYCKAAKAYMDERGIEYLEKNVEVDLESRQEMHERGGRGVPFLVVYGENMKGFDVPRFERIRWENR